MGTSHVIQRRHDAMSLPPLPAIERAARAYRASDGAAWLIEASRHPEGHWTGARWRRVAGADYPEMELAGFSRDASCRAAEERFAAEIAIIEGGRDASRGAVEDAIVAELNALWGDDEA